MKEPIRGELATQKNQKAERMVMKNAMVKFLKSDDAKLIGGMPKEFSYAALGIIHKQLDKRFREIWRNKEIEETLTSMIDGHELISEAERAEGKRGASFWKHSEMLQQLKKAGITVEMDETGGILFRNLAQEENSINSFAYEMKDRYKDPELGRQQEEANVKMSKVKRELRNDTYTINMIFMMHGGKAPREIVETPAGCYIAAQRRIAEARENLQVLTADGKLNVKRLAAAREVCKELIALEPQRKAGYAPKEKPGRMGPQLH